MSLLKPFGKWPNFQACLTDMQGPPNNYDEETAKKVCGKLQHRLEGKQVFKILKSSTGRRIIAQYVSVEDMDRDRDIIPKHRIFESLENLKTMDPRYHNVNWKHSSYQIGHPLWQFKDEAGVDHRTEVDEYGLWGITEIRNDGYQKADEIWNMILDDVPMGASIALRPSAKPFYLTKEDVESKGLNPKWAGAKYWDVPLQAIEPWSLTLDPANQFVTPAVILSKDQGICDTDVCKGVCCTFITQWEPELTADLEKYYALHSIEVKEVDKGAWLKLPIPCESFDAETYQCKTHNDRPEICKNYPKRESPFIPKELCSLLKSRLTKPSSISQVIAPSILKDECEPCVEARADWYLRKGYEIDYLTALERAEKWYLEKEKQDRKSDVQRAKEHYKLTDEEWAELSPSRKQQLLDQLPPRGSRLKDPQSTMRKDDPANKQETPKKFEEEPALDSIKKDMELYLKDLMKKHGF